MGSNSFRGAMPFDYRWHWHLYESQCLDINPLYCGIGELLSSCSYSSEIILHVNHKFSLAHHAFSFISIKPSLTGRDWIIKAFLGMMIDRLRIIMALESTALRLFVLSWDAKIFSSVILCRPNILHQWQLMIVSIDILMQNVSYLFYVKMHKCTMSRTSINQTETMVPGYICFNCCQPENITMMINSR